MTKVQIVGRKAHVEAVLRRLYRLGLLELLSAHEDPTLAVAPFPDEDERAEHETELRLLVARLDGLLAHAGSSDATQPRPETPDAGEVSRELRTLAPLVERQVDRIEDLRTELAVLPRYIKPLQSLLPLVPQLAELDESEIHALELDAVALVLNTEDDSVVDVLREALRTELGTHFALVATRVDADAIGCVIVTPHSEITEVQALLGRERVRSLPLPPRYENLSFRGAVAAMESRLAEIPAELGRAEAELHDLLAPRAVAWRAARERLVAELEQVEAVGQVGATSRAFVVVGWTPRAQVTGLRQELELAAGGQLVLEELESPSELEPPVLMRNARPAHPFEFLVRFLDLPRAGSLDPTVLMALILPFMVGVMVGDIVYGTLLLGLALLVNRRFAAGSLAVRDLSRVFVAGAVWAIVFGFLYGEALGDVGHKLGLPALWFYRGGTDAVEPLLLFSLAIGSVHVVLGQSLGLWQSASTGRTSELVNRAGSLLALIGVFALVGVAVERLPGGRAATAIAMAVVVVGLVLLTVRRGALGLVMAPLELVGTVGNVLSYLRLGAVGLASTYLALVANELAVLGPIWLGIFIGVFFHALNLALASFSPMIQALRLHYVEFFSKFYEPGGRPFRPFGDRITS